MFESVCSVIFPRSWDEAAWTVVLQIFLLVLFEDRNYIWSLLALNSFSWLTFRRQLRVVLQQQLPSNHCCITWDPLDSRMSSLFTYSLTWSFLSKEKFCLFQIFPLILRTWENQRPVLPVETDTVSSPSRIQLPSCIDLQTDFLECFLILAVWGILNWSFAAYSFFHSADRHLKFSNHYQKC